MRLNMKKNIWKPASRSPPGLLMKSWHRKVSLAGPQLQNQGPIYATICSLSDYSVLCDVSSDHGSNLITEESD